MVFHLFILCAVEDGHGRAQANLILGDIVHVDQRQVGESLAKLADARLQVLLALLGRVIFGVLAEVPQRYGLLELSGDIEGQLMLERVQFFSQLFFNLFCHRFGHYNAPTRGMEPLCRFGLTLLPCAPTY